MKKYIQNIWVRVVAVLICVFTVMGLALSAVGMFFFMNNRREDFLAYGQGEIMENYALYALDHLGDDDLEAFLAESNVYVAIDHLEYLKNESGEKEQSLTRLYSNLPDDVEDIQEIHIYEGSYYSYNVRSLLRAFNSGVYSNDYSVTAVAPIIGYVYDVESGLFYYETAVGYFKVEYLDGVTMYGESYDYVLTHKDGKECYYNSYYNRMLNPEEYRSWDWVRIADKRMQIAEATGQSRNVIRPIYESAQIAEDIRYENYYYEDYNIRYVSNEVNQYVIRMAMNPSLEKQDLLVEWGELVERIYYFEDKIIATFWLCLSLFLTGILLLLLSAPSQTEKLRFFHKMPLLLFSGIVVGLEVAGGFGLALWIEYIVYPTNGAWTIGVDEFVNMTANICFFMLALAFTWLANVITRIKTGTIFRYSELYYVTRPFASMGRLIRDNMSLMTKVLLVMGLISVVEVLFIIELSWASAISMLFYIPYKLLQVLVLIYVLAQMKQLQEGSKRIASGDLSQPIDTSRMLWELKKHGDNINKMGEGISIAVEEQLKSERFKTELITNVSHDIKTPLTSIINYVDLIKKEDVSDPKMEEYVEVLDRQSARLKKLIEDLMEASKASTGNLEVHPEECDMQVMLTQVIGEFGDKLAANQLEVILEQPEEPVHILADGRHLWRVLDNLMNNVCKYSQANTRVYVSLKEAGGMAEVVFKNISKSALNIPSNQLMQRFVRGDSSRHTEGSGLGLSIAQSLTELMGGTMKLEIDGDLFKVTLKFNSIA